MAAAQQPQRRRQQRGTTLCRAFYRFALLGPGMSLIPSLRALAAQLEAEGQPILAIKCLLACLQQSPVPVDEIVVSLHLARLLLEQTTDSRTQAKQRLQHVVSGRVGSRDWAARGAAAARRIAPRSTLHAPGPPPLAFTHLRLAEHAGVQAEKGLGAQMRGAGPAGHRP
jgi:hypothetical protein